MGKVTVTPPYKPENVKGAANTAVQHVRKIVSSGKELSSNMPTGSNSCSSYRLRNTSRTASGSSKRPPPLRRERTTAPQLRPAVTPTRRLLRPGESRPARTRRRPRPPSPSRRPDRLRLRRRTAVPTRTRTRSLEAAAAVLRTLPTTPPTSPRRRRKAPLPAGRRRPRSQCITIENRHSYIM